MWLGLLLMGRGVFWWVIGMVMVFGLMGCVWVVGWCSILRTRFWLLLWRRCL